MADLRDIEIATAYGSLDTTCVTDGDPYSAHVLRTIATSNNRLATKGQVLFNLIWPERNLDVAEPPSMLGQMGGAAWPYWTPMGPPIPVHKRHGSTKMDVRIRMKVDEDHTVWVWVRTNANRNAPQLMQTDTSSAVAVKGAGSGAWQNVSFDDIAIDPGGREHVQFMIKGQITGVEASGGEATGAAHTNAAFDDIEMNQITDDTADWSDAINAAYSSYSEQGCYLLFRDGTASDSAVIAEPKIITYAGGVRLRFWPGLNHGTQFLSGPGLINEIAEAGHYLIENATQYQVAQLAGVSVARTY